VTVQPPSPRTSGRLTRRCAAQPSARIALCAACLLGFALDAQAAGAAAPPALREKDVRRAEKVVAKLRLLDGAAAAGDDAKPYRALAAKFYPGLFVTVADMRESDLKTDLDTAAFIHARVSRTWFAAGASKANCEYERRDIYLPLCLDLRGGTVRQLLLSKARLHVRWAEAIVKNYGREDDADTSRELAAIRAARANDSLIAARVIETLRPLEGLVNTFPTYADYLERPAVSKVGFDRLDAEFADALSIASQLISSLPRGLAFYHLSNARDSYRDGLFWYRKVHGSRKLVVSANAFGRDPLADLRLNADQVGYTVIVNWRTAVKYTRLAELMLSRPLSLSSRNAVAPR
jgi:hypothetical protein